jgi:hypothetical protein
MLLNALEEAGQIIFGGPHLSRKVGVARMLGGWFMWRFA